MTLVRKTSFCLPILHLITNSLSFPGRSSWGETNYPTYHAHDRRMSCHPWALTTRMFLVILHVGLYPSNDSDESIASSDG